MSAKTIFIALDTDLDLDGVLKVAGDIKSLYKKARYLSLPLSLGWSFFAATAFMG